MPICLQLYKLLLQISYLNQYVTIISTCFETSHPCPISTFYHYHVSRIFISNQTNKNDIGNSFQGSILIMPHQTHPLHLLYLMVSNGCRLYRWLSKPSSRVPTTLCFLLVSVCLVFKWWACLSCILNSTDSVFIASLDMYSDFMLLILKMRKYLYSIPFHHLFDIGMLF